MASQGVQNYLNTLIFCVIAKAITIFILAFMVNEKVRYFSFFLLTVEIGLVIIIVSALIIIAMYDKRMSKQKDNYNNSKLSSITCPDYYIQTSQDGERFCEDTYTTPDKKFTYVFNLSTDGYLSKIPIEADFQDLKIDDICNTIQSYSNLSWTSVKSKCNYT